jgi:hypothetical protein
MPKENWTRYPPHHSDFLDPRRVMEITFEVARLDESLSRSHQARRKILARTADVLVGISNPQRWLYGKAA